MTMNSSNTDRLNSVVAKVLAGMNPPEDLTVTEWADKYRRLPRSAAEPGQWRTSRTPYLREPMNAFTDPKIRRIVMVASSQVGKSEFELNCIGYIIHQDPGNILYIHPDIDDAKKFSQIRVGPLIQESDVLRSRVSKAKSRDSGNTLLRKSFPGGMLIMCGTNVPDDLASTPCRYVFGDERDRWAVSAGNEGDPWKLATARQITFYNSKAVEVSTPTIKNASKIARSFAEGTMERWCVRCPHCSGYHDIHFSDIRYTVTEKIIQKEKQYEVSDIYYICPECACISTERQMKKQPAKWIADNPDAYKRGVRSFWLNSFVSPWASWESSILEYLYAIGDSKSLQVVYNTRFGELWEDRGDIEDEDSLMGRRDVEAYGLEEGGTPIELPDGVLVLTAGVDTQDNRMEYEVVGHGHFGETWGIEKGIVMGRPDDDETWAKLDEVLFNRVFRFADGLGLPVSLTFVDQGGHFSGEVRLACHDRIRKKVFAIMGSKNHDAPYTKPPKEQKIMIQEQYIGTCWMYEIGVDAGKQRIMDNLRVQTPGPNYCHFPRRDDYGSSYFAGLLSERLEYDASKKQPWVWKKIPGHERNEALDCRNYAMAAFKALPKDLDAIDRQLKAMRGQRPPAAVATPPAAPAARRPKAKKAGSRLNEYFDDW
ncbi:MAG: phage terminase large subunit family protein [Oscillospiraceae bacterium]|nr:phage terminase large subunit family protein [Oscillospiraceae bacterium]